MVSRSASRLGSDAGRAGFVALLWIDTDNPRDFPASAFWRVAGALGAALGQVGRLLRPPHLPPSRESRLLADIASQRETRAAAVADVATRLPESLSVMALVSGAIEAWGGDEVALVDRYAAAVCAAARRPAAWIEQIEDGERCRPGCLLVPRSAATAPALEQWIAGEARESLDLRVLRHLRELELEPSRVADALRGDPLRWLRRLGARARDLRWNLDRFEIATDEEPGSAALRVEGWIAARPAVRRLALAVGPRRYYLEVARERPDVAAKLPWVADPHCGFAFAHRVVGLPAGSHRIALERLDGRVLARLGTVDIAPERRERPRPPLGRGAIAIDRARVGRTGAANRLEVAGTVDFDGPVDCVRLRLGGRVVYDGDPGSSLSPVTGGGSRRLEVDEPFEGGSGSGLLTIELLRRQDVVASWQGTPVRIATEAGEVRFDSLALDRLERAETNDVWGDLVLGGSLEGIVGGEVSLSVDDEIVARRPLVTDGTFEVRHEAAPGPHSGRLVARVGGEAVADSRPFAFRAHPVAAPRGWSSWVAELTRALAEWEPGWGDVSPEALAGRLAARCPEQISGLDRALESLAESAAAAASHPAKLVEELPPPKRPLRVLFASWEIPWPGHGGGVATLNLLRYLGGRHEITLLHPEHPGAEGLSEIARPYVREIVAVRRGWHSVSPLASYELPDRNQRTYSPELSAAVAGATLGDGFEVVNLEFEGMAPHALGRHLLPTVGVMHEVASFARCQELRKVPDDLDEAAVAFERWLSALAFDVRVVSRRFGELATLTEPEARFLARFLPDREIAVNPIAVDVESLATAATRGERSSRPRFVFVGTFRHPPNRAAATELVERIAPELRRELPGSELLLVGSDPPAELVDRAAATGVDCLGWVEDLPALLGSATAFLAPIHTGAGMRVKLLEAMACGCAVVSTSLGLSGIPARPEAEALVAETPEAFAVAARRLADDEPLRARLAAAAQAMIRRVHGLEVQGERRERLWARAIGRH